MKEQFRLGTFNKVLLATDLTPQSDNLLGCLVSLCPDVETEVVLAHVFDDDEDADPHGSEYKDTIEHLDGYKVTLADTLTNNGVLNIIDSKNNIKLFASFSFTFHFGKVHFLSSDK